MDMATGKLSVWHVAEGEAVSKGAPLFDIETDKAAMEVESPASGRLHHVIAGPGETVDVGKPVAWIYAEGEEVGSVPGGVPVAPAPAAAPADARATADDTAPSVLDADGDNTLPGDPGAVRATPAARKLARSAGVLLADVPGTGPSGRVQREDVATFAKAPPGPVAEPAPEPRAVCLGALADSKPAPGRAPQPEPAFAAPALALSEPGDLAVSVRKGTGTPLVMIHGFAADSYGWMPLERELPGDLPLVRIDLPAHGRSPRQAVRDFQDLSRAVRIAFDKAVDGKVHVLAHSLGGAVALALADVRPRSIASLTLIAPAGLGPEIDGAALGGIARASRAESLAPWLKRLTATPDAIGWDFVKAAMLARSDEALRAAQLEMADALFPDGVQGFDLRAALDRVTAPTAVIWGKNDYIVPWRHALAASGEMALHLLGEVGHIPHVECPSKVAAILRRNIGQACRS